MRRPEHRLETAGQRLIGEQCVEIHGDFGHPDPMPLGRDRRVQISERLLVVEPGALRHEAFDELQHTAGTIDKPAENLARIGIDGAVAPLVEQPFGFRRTLRPAADRGMSGNSSTRSGCRPPRTALFALHRPERKPHRETCRADRLRPNDVAPRQRSPNRIPGGAVHC